MLVSEKKTRHTNGASTLVGEPNTSANKWSTGDQRRARSKPSKEHRQGATFQPGELEKAPTLRHCPSGKLRSKFIQIIDDYLLQIHSTGSHPRFLNQILL